MAFTVNQTISFIFILFFLLPLLIPEIISLSGPNPSLPIIRISGPPQVWINGTFTPNNQTLYVVFNLPIFASELSTLVPSIFLAFLVIWPRTSTLKENRGTDYLLLGFKILIASMSLTLFATTIGMNDIFNLSATFFGELGTTFLYYKRFNPADFSSYQSNAYLYLAFFSRAFAIAVYFWSYSSTYSSFSDLPSLTALLIWNTIYFAVDTLYMTFRVFTPKVWGKEFNSSREVHRTFLLATFYLWFVGFHILILAQYY